MLSHQSHRIGSITEEIPLYSQPIHLGPPPSSLLGRAKYYYDKYKCRHFAPFLLLFFYSLLGAWIFYLVEHENEKKMKLIEAEALNILRDNTLDRLVDVVKYTKPNDSAISTREILLWYENELHRVKLPKALAWDMWGALFYVGTIFTTIGYGNIVPRTVAGRALSVVYAIIGIPLVLAILSRSGLSLTTWVSRAWQRYRRHIKQASVKAKKCLRMAQRSQISVQHLEDGKLDVMKLDEIEEYEIDQKPESKTIPIWLALLTCISWICACAGLFMIWEKQWTFFTSLYFFFISLSTIGLGDVVPDHPHMLILMFWLVIIGLTLVSMLLAVIQIKIEEWLYTLMVKIQKEIQRKAAEGQLIDKSGIVEKLMKKENPLMQFVASCISEEKNGEIWKEVDKFERTALETNTKNIQTEALQGFVASTQVDNCGNSMACDPMSSLSEIPPVHCETQWSKQQYTLEPEIIPFGSISGEERDSISDATSLPMDSLSISGGKFSEKIVEENGSCRMCSKKYEDLLVQSLNLPNNGMDRFDEQVQTDIAQFQIDEIVLRLAALQTQRIRPSFIERSMETSIIGPYKDHTRSDSISQKNETEKNLKDMTDKEILTEMLNVMTQSMETDAAIGKKMADHAINTTQIFSNTCGTETSPVSHRTQAVETDPNVITTTSMETDKATLVEKSVETSRSEQLDNGTQISWTEKAKRDIITSPIVQKLIGGPFWKSPTAPSIENNDQSIQTVFYETNVELPQKSQYIDRSLQTSMDDLNFEGSISCYQQPPIGINSLNSDENTDRSLQTSYHSGIDRSFQTSRQGSTEKTMRSIQTSHHEGVDQSIETNRVIVMSRSMETGHWEPMLETNSSKGEKLKKPSSSLYDDIKMNDSVEISTQYSPPMTRSVTKEPRGSSLGVTITRARSISTSGMGTSIFDDEARQEVIIQTDDSYLKIARRLDEYRNNRTQFLPVCAASPLDSKEVEPFKTDRPSERRGFYIDSTAEQRMRSMMRMRRKSFKKDNSHTEAGTSVDQKQLNCLLNTERLEKCRSISPAPRNRGVLMRKASLPTGISRGKVGEYIAQHERGIPNPATMRLKPIEIIRQYAMDNKET